MGKEGETPDKKIFRDIFSDGSNRLSSGRIMSVICIIAAVVASFGSDNSAEVIAFLSAGVGGKTIQKFAER